MKFIYKFSLLSSSAFVSQYLILNYWLYSTKSSIFGTNDDELISSLVNGHLTESSEIRLIFIQPIIGIFLKFIHPLLPQINVYAHFLLSVVILSYSLIISAILLMRNSLYKYISLIFILLLDITFITWFSINPTYTGASLFAVGAASFLFLFALKINKKLDSIFISCIANLMLVIGFLIRKESIFIFLIISIPTIFNYLIMNKNEFKYKLKIIILSLFFILGINLINNISINSIYSGEEWNEYLKMNNARHQIQLRTPELEMEKNLTAINWDKETYILFKRFSLLDKNSMNSKTMNQIISSTSDFIGPRSLLNSKINESIEKVILAFNPWTWILKIIIIYPIFILLILLFSKNYEKIPHLIVKNFIYICAIFFLIIVLGAGYQLPERITLNLLAASAPIMILLNYDDPKFDITLNRYFRICIIFSFIALSYFYLERFKIETEARMNFYKTRIAYSISQQRDLKNIEKNRIVIGSASVFKADWRFPYSKHEPFGNDQKIISLSWLNLSPIWMNYLDSLGINGSNFPKEYFNKSILIVDNPEKIIDLEKYLLNRNFDFKIKSLGDFGDSDFQIYQLIN